MRITIRASGGAILAARRDQVLTLRLTPGEIQLLAALRFSFCAASQADVVSFALEDLCARIATGEPMKGVHEPAAPQLCADALQAYCAEERLSWRGRPATYATPRERAAFDQAHKP